MATKAFFCSTTIVLALGAMSPAQAAENAPGVSPPHTSVLEEIVVTAQKRGQAINDIPMVIAAATGEELADQQITSAIELVKLVVPDRGGAAVSGDP